MGDMLAELKAQVQALVAQTRAQIAEWNAQILVWKPQNYKRMSALMGSDASLVAQDRKRIYSAGTCFARMEAEILQTE